jgi:hypothetical protein
MRGNFLAMQLAVASHDGGEQIHPLVRRLWSASRTARHVPDAIALELEACAHELIALAHEPPPEREERLRAAEARVEDVFVALALLAPVEAA